MSVQRVRVADDFEYILSFLPEGWEEKARELGALRRCRKVPDATTLLRVLLIHLADGCSLRETAMRAREGDLVDLTDVAILHRLRCATEWFHWMNTELMATWISRQPEELYGKRWRVRLVDTTHIQEPGPTGSSWYMHYAISLPSLRCDQFRLVDKHGRGETFRNFHVQQGDLLIGDRVYGVRGGIQHVLAHGGHVIVRFARTNLPLQTPAGRSFDLLKHLRGLRDRQLGDWSVILQHGGALLPGRVCAVRMSRQARERAQKRVRRRARENKAGANDATLEAAGYITVFTSLPKHELGTTKVLEFYRGRWQVELVFKRLKSVMELSHLRKIDKASAMAWLQGKIFIAFLVEALIRHGESFFPWGFPLDPSPIE